MHVDPKGTLFGYPAMRVRDLLRYLSWGDAWTVECLMERLNVSESEAARVLCELADLGYVETAAPGWGEGRWKTTIKGSALGLASAAPPLRRATADRVVQRFLERVRHINADPYYLYRVSKAVVFGSYLSDRERINDVDLGVCLQPKETDLAKHSARCRKRSAMVAERGRRFRNCNEEVGWAETEVLRFLKCRSRAIGLHYGDPILERVTARVLFDACCS